MTTPVNNGSTYLPNAGEGTVPLWPGSYSGTVVNNDDPLGVGRLQMNVPQVLGNSVSAWAVPLGVYYTIPNNGTTVACSFIGGDPSQPTWIGPLDLNPAIIAAAPPTVTYASSQPPDPRVKDIWYPINNTVSPETVGAPEIWTFDPGTSTFSWVVQPSIGGTAIAPGAVGLTQLSGTVTARALNGVTTTLGTTPPVSGMLAGDIFINDATGQVFQYSGGTWNAITINASTVIQAGTIVGNQIVAGASISSPLISGATISGSTFVGTNWVEDIDGSFLYNGTPAVGNLVVSIAPASTTADSLGNPVLGGGVAAYSSVSGISSVFFPNGITFNNIPSGILSQLSMNTGQLRLDGTGRGISQFIVGDAQLAFDTSGGAGFGCVNGSLPLLAQTTNPTAVGSTSQHYADSNGNPSVILPSGLTGAVPVVQTDVTTHTNTNGGTEAISTVWSIPANDAQVGTVYELALPFSGETGSVAGQLGWQVAISGTAFGNTNIGPGFFSTLTQFNGDITATLQVTRTGTTGTAILSLKGGVGINNTRSSGTNNNNAYLSSVTTISPFNTTINSTLTVQSVWASGSTAATITGFGSKFTRSGP
jgi:Type VI secretion system/phage-baseplate injector OB domain